MWSQRRRGWRAHFFVWTNSMAPRRDDFFYARLKNGPGEPWLAEHTGPSLKARAAYLIYKRPGCIGRLAPRHAIFF